jgi:hypothetical protein
VWRKALDAHENLVLGLQTIALKMYYGVIISGAIHHPSKERLFHVRVAFAALGEISLAACAHYTSSPCLRA